MSPQVVRYSERPELWESISGLSDEVWPEYNQHGDAGVAGSLIATYGGQSRERRKARSEVMACLQRLETARLTRTAKEGFFDYDDKRI